MSLLDIFGKLFCRRTAKKDSDKTDAAGGSAGAAAAADGGKKLFVISFKHSQKTAEFIASWKDVEGLSSYLGGERGLKMGNFFVPWSEVANIYCEDEAKAPDDTKKDDKVDGNKPGDVPSGSDTAGVVSEPKDASIDEVRAAVEEEKEIKAEKI